MSWQRCSNCGILFQQARSEGCCLGCGKDEPPAPGVPRWYWAYGKEKRGPYSLLELQRVEEIKPTDMLLPEGAQKWEPASSVKGLIAPDKGGDATRADLEEIRLIMGIAIGVVGLSVALLLTFYAFDRRTACWICLWSVVGGFIGGGIANRKGAHVLVGFLLGALLGPILIWLMVFARTNMQAVGLRKCPHCAEWVKNEALVCKHCHKDLPPPVPA
jgi:hypothetical protein